MVHANKSCCYQTFTDCCRNCSQCSHCFDLSVSKVRDILYSINKKIVDYSCGTVSKANYGYLVCNDLTKEDFQTLLDLKESLKRFYIELIRGYDHCLCPEDIQTIYEKALDLVDIECCKSPDRCDLSIDESGLDLWVLEHPGCLAFEEWERAAISCFLKVGIKIKVIDDPSRLDFNIKVKSLLGACTLMNEFKTGSIQNPAKVLKTLSTLSQITPRVTKQDCKLDYDVLIKSQKCDISFNTYSKLIECNLTPTIISSLLSCNIGLEYNVKRNTCDLVINPESRISLCDLDFNVSSENINCTLLSEITGRPYICDEIAEIIDIQ